MTMLNELKERRRRNPLKRAALALVRWHTVPGGATSPLLQRWQQPAAWFALGCPRPQPAVKSLSATIKAWHDGP
jgi:hypothetical protein